MRAHEFINENDQLNEIFPLLAMGLWQLVQWALTLWTVKLVWDTVSGYTKKTGGDISKLSDDDWLDIVVALVIAVVASKIPGASAWVKSKFSKTTPETKAKIVNAVKPKLMSMVKKFADSNTGLATVGATAVGANL